MVSGSNTFMQHLGLRYPILQAPMAGGGDTPDMVIAARKAGALGSIGCSYLTAEEITAAVGKVRSACGDGFGVNLFAPMAPSELPEDAEKALAFITPYYRELGLDDPQIPPSGGFDFDSQVEAVLDAGARMFSFAFGIMPVDLIRAAKSRSMYVMGTATTVGEALALEESGVDAVVAQGSEAGAHRGTFAGGFDSGMIGTIALVPSIVQAVSVPVVASGGIGCGRGIAAALTLGAAAAQLGTAFLTCTEAGIPQVYKDAILQAKPDDTRITRAFSGRPARGITNRVIEAAEAAPGEDAILPFPYQNALTRPLRATAAKQGRPEFLSLWAGQGLCMARALGTAELIETLAAETETALRETHAIYAAP